MMDASVRFFLFPIRLVVFLGLFLTGCLALLFGCFMMFFEVGRHSWQVASGEKTTEQIYAELDSRS